MGVRIKRIRPDPKPAITAKELAALIRDVQYEEAQKVVADYHTTTSTWKKRPVWRIQPTRFGFNVFTDNAIFSYVDEGTRPHAITPKGPYPLRFKVKGFRPKTRPGRFKAVSGRKASGPDVYAAAVQHPGTKPRKLTQQVQKRSERRISRAMDSALKKAVRKRRA